MSEYKKVLITGGANGIGLAIVKRFISSHQVIILDNDRKRCELIKKKYPQALIFVVDISDKKMLEKIRLQISKKVGTLDIIINNAGLQTVSNFFDLQETDWRKVLDVNLTGVFLCLQVFLPVMNRGGTVLNIISVHHNKPRLNKYHYDASKAGVTILTKEVALLIADRNITVNALAIGAVSTNMNKDWLGNYSKTKSVRDLVPMEIIFTPKQVGEIVYNIINFFSQFTTGSIFTIDGGRSLNKMNKYKDIFNKNFNDFCWNCKFDSLQNVLKLYGRDSFMVMANNIPMYTQKGIEYVFGYENSELLSLIGIVDEQQNITSFREMIRIIKKAIKRKELVCIKGDEYYIPNSNYYKINHEKSNILIYGYHCDEYYILWRTQYDQVYKKIKLNEESLQLIFKGYIKYYHEIGLDKEPTVHIYKNTTTSCVERGSIWLHCIRKNKDFILNTYSSNNFNELKTSFIENSYKFINHKNIELIRIKYFYQGNNKLMGIIKEQILILKKIFESAQIIPSEKLIEYFYILETELLNLMEDILSESIEDINTSEKVEQFFSIINLQNHECVQDYVKILSKNVQNNSINGEGYFKKGKCNVFYKKLPLKLAILELKGYVQLIYKFKVPKIKGILAKDDFITVLFEYLPVVQTKRGLLQNSFINQSLSKVQGRVLDDFIFSCKQSLGKHVIKSEYPLQLYFKDRIYHRVLQWYKHNSFGYRLENSKITLKEILIKSVDYFIISERDKKCFYSQGDFNSMNILSNSTVFDFTTAGINAIDAEVVVLFWSLLIGDTYFYPKYHRDSYVNSPDSLKFIDIHQIKCNLKGEVIFSDGFIKITSQRKELIKNYLSLFENSDLLSKNIKYYFVIRALTVFNINYFKICDQYYCIYILLKIYSILDRSDSPLDGLYEIIESCEVVEYDNID